MAQELHFIVNTGVTRERNGIKLSEDKTDDRLM